MAHSFSKLLAHLNPVLPPPASFLPCTDRSTQLPGSVFWGGQGLRLGPGILSSGVLGWLSNSGQLGEEEQNCLLPNWPPASVLLTSSGLVQWPESACQTRSPARPCSAYSPHPLSPVEMPPSHWGLLRPPYLKGQHS